MNDEAAGYTDALAGGVELMWGEGFMSPGGSEEVGMVVRGLDLEGRTILDIGSGLGGPAICLLSQHGAGSVVGVDVDPRNIERAKTYAAKAGMDGRLRFELVGDARYPFDDAAFDLVFSKDAIIEAPDKGAIIAEAYRVLRPGGWIAISDWFRGAEPLTQEMSKWVARAGPTLALGTMAEMVNAFEAAGFADIRAEDRNAWYREYSKRELERMTGADRPLFEKFLGHDVAEEWIDVVRLKCAAVEQGQLRPGHVRARKQ